MNWFSRMLGEIDLRGNPFHKAGLVLVAIVLMIGMVWGMSIQVPKALQKILPKREGKVLGTQVTLSDIHRDGNIFNTPASDSYSELNFAPGNAERSDGIFVNVNGDFYLLGGGSGTILRFYDTSGDQWLNKAKAPGGIGGKNCDAFWNESDYIYVVSGSNFYRYSISANSWSTLAAPLSGASNFPKLVWNSTFDSNTIYFWTGTTNFAKYSISGDSWTALDLVPADPDCDELFYTTANDIYAVRGADGSVDFYHYDITGNSWTSKTDIPDSTKGANHPEGFWDGSNYIYLLPDVNYLYRYSISGNSWYQMANSNISGTWGVEVFYDGTDTVYMLNGAYGGSGYNWVKYTISSETKTEISDCPFSGVSSHDRTDYKWIDSTHFMAYYGQDFFSYDISDSWSNLAYIPGGLDNSYNYEPNLKWIGGDRIYHIAETPHNGDFSFYSFSSDSWNSLTDHGGNTYWNVPVWDREDSLYWTANLDLKKYSISGDFWTDLANSPGHLISASGHKGFYNGDNYFYHCTGNYVTFFRYNTSGDSWATLTYPPQGGYTSQNIWPNQGDGDYIYMARGESYGTFWRYSISGNSWDTMATVPVGVDEGSALLWDHDDYIYLVVGNDTPAFYRYSITGNSWDAMTNVPASIFKGSRSWYDGRDYIYVTQGGGDESEVAFYRYSITGNSWDTLTDLPLPPYSYYGQQEGGAYMQNLGSGQLAMAPTNGYPDLWTYRIGGNNYQRNNGKDFPVTEFNVIGGVGKNRAFTNFDTSSLPDNAVIQDVKLKVNVTKAYGGSDTVDILSNANEINNTNYPNDDTGNSNLHTDLAGGTLLVNDSADFQSTGWKTIDLGSTGESELQANLPNDHFSLGLVGSDETTDWSVFSSDEFLKSSLDPELFVEYATDLNEPTNPTTLTAYDSNAKNTTLTSGNWYNYEHPYFEFTGATDDYSGLAGYYIYFGTDDTADPETSGTYQAHVGAEGATQSYTVTASLTSGNTYYLRIKTKDQAHNITSGTWTPFTYKPDFDDPDEVEYVNVSPVGCSKSTNFTFSWPASADALSGIAGYTYKNGSTGSDQFIATNALENVHPYQSGDNVLYVKAKDNAGNHSSWTTAVYCHTAGPSIIEGPTVDAAPSAITVSFVTNVSAAGYVKVMRGNNYVSEQGHTEYSKSHIVKIVGLKPEVKYRYQVRFIDQHGNLNQTGWYRTRTTAPPHVKDFAITDVRQTSTIVSWQTTAPTTGTLMYGIGGYTNSISMGGSFGSNYSTTLSSLDAGKTYQLIVRCTDQDGYQFDSNQGTFTTPPYPEISNLRFQPLEDRPTVTIKVTWDTNVETSSAISCSPAEGGAGGKEIKTASEAKLVKSHEIILSDLSDQTKYNLVATGRDQYGNTCTSDTQTLTTAEDTRPPEVFNVTIETSVIGVGRESKSQIVVSWETDEPATSQVEYGIGVGGDTYQSKTAEDAALTTSHTIIISELDPSRSYHLKAVSRDEALNQGEGPDNVVITGKRRESVLDIIIDKLRETFGFLTKIGELFR